MNNLVKLYEKYPWLKIKTTVKEYVDPKYYNKILKPYIFDWKTDEDIFINSIQEIWENKFNSTLELWCWSWRITELFLKKFNYNNFDLVDFSNRMLSFSMKKFTNYDNLFFIESDTIKFLENCNKKYDLIFSLWSFSHSTHQIFSELWLEYWKKYITKILKKMLLENLNDWWYFFLIHFDSLSDEQKILMKQWKKVFPIFHDLEKQSPSKLLIDDILFDLKNEWYISYTQEHKIWQEIIYNNLEEALEIFMNFHMESFFNKNKLLLWSIIDELIEYFNNFKNNNGNIEIKPWCFIYKVKKYEKSNRPLLR